MSAIENFDALAAAQPVRKFDIYALGPLMLYAATRKSKLGPWTRRSLFVAGCMTIVYNWKAYREASNVLKQI